MEEVNGRFWEHRDALQRILASLVTMAGLGSPTIQRHVHRAVFRLLRPAESATRRLVIVLARGLTVTLKPARPGKPEPIAPPPVKTYRHFGSGMLVPAFAMPRSGPPPKPARKPPQTVAFTLLDPLPYFYTHPMQDPPRRRRIASSIPRIRSLERDAIYEPTPIYRPPRADDEVGAARLGMRLAALGNALDDLPKQALRLARWRARNQRERDRGKIRRVSPLRLGPPRGMPRWKTRRHEVHDILQHAHELAWWALNRPADTS